MNTQRVYIEHANITVNNLDNAIKFFKTAFPNFKIRGGGMDNGKEWIHLGDDSTYLALNAHQNRKNIRHEKDYDKNGFNHIGFVVCDVKSLAKRLLAAGYVRDYPKQVETYRIRDYFADADGNEYEFVQYLSDNIEERNSFEL